MGFFKNYSEGDTYQQNRLWYVTGGKLLIAGFRCSLGLKVEIMSCVSFQKDRMALYHFVGDGITWQIGHPLCTSGWSLGMT